jgi:SRSO17 transposase
VQRQYLGCVGKVDNGIVTVHIGVAKGRFQALLTADLYLPESWDADRQRCREAGIPDDVHYRAKWRIALDQLIRLDGNGVRFDWLTFDEDYGSKVPFLAALSLVGQKFVAEVPVSFAVHRGLRSACRRADEVLSEAAARRGRRFRLKRRTSIDQVWRAVSVPVWVQGRQYVLVAAINEATGEVKYFVSNATAEPLRRLLAVAFRRATIEQLFRLGKQEAGLMHYEGRHYVGLLRHLTLALIVMGFVSVHTERLRGEKPTGDDGAGLPGVERALCDAVSPASESRGDGAGRASDPLSSTTQRASGSLTQETAA